MEIKKINKLLLGIFVFHIVIVVLIAVFPEIFQIGIILNLSLGELILFLPTLVYLFLWRVQTNKEMPSDNMYKEATFDVESEPTFEKKSLWKRLHFKKVRPSTYLYVLLFTWLSMPLTTLINAISMLFVDNTVMSLTDLILEMPFPIMLLLMAVIPAFCEEVVFRGVVYGGYRRDGYKFAAVLLSGFMFGIMHMNLNQALYAFAIGILLALLLEATNSIFTTMLFHFIYNAQSCCLMYLTEAALPEYASEAVNIAVEAEELYLVISMYLLIAAVSTPLAFCILYKIAKNEKCVDQLKETLPRRQKRRAENAPQKIVTVSYILATVIAVGYIIFDIILSKFF